jgi:hypothetical protein
MRVDVKIVRYCEHVRTSSYTQLTENAARRIAEEVKRRDVLRVHCTFHDVCFN